MTPPLSREQVVVIKSLAHQFVIKWAGILIGVNQQNGDAMHADIVKLVSDFTVVTDAALRQQLDDLRDWRAIVTVSLGMEGGAFFADVPKHITDLVSQVADLQQQLAAVTKSKEQLDATLQAVYMSREADYHNRDVIQLQLTAARQALADEQELRMKAEQHITFMQTVSTEQLETIRRLTKRSANEQDH